MIPQMIRRRQKRRNHRRETRNSSGKSGSKTRWRAGEGTTKKPHYYYYYWAFNEPRSNEHFTTLHNTSQEHADPTPTFTRTRTRFQLTRTRSTQGGPEVGAQPQHVRGEFSSAGGDKNEGESYGLKLFRKQARRQKSSRVLGRLKFGIRRGTGFLIGPAVMIYKPGASAWVR